MKKIVGFSLVILLILFLLFLPRYLVIDEVVGLYVLPIFLVIVIASLVYGIARIFKKIQYRELVLHFLIVAVILQIIILSLILWLASPKYFSRKQVDDDIAYMIKTDEEVHPNLFANISRKDFLAKTDSIKNTLPEKISIIEAYKKISNVCSLIHDGHTSCTWDLFSDGFSYLFVKTLPYNVVIQNGRMYVAGNYFYRNTIPIGSEIVKINGKPVNQCISEASHLISYESTAYRNALLRNPYIWGLWNDSRSFEIAYKKPDSHKTKTVRASGGLISNILASRQSPGLNYYSYKTLPGNVGYLDFNSFENLTRFKIFLKKTFRKIKENKVRNLIVDIRKNGGGNSSLGNELLQYVSKSDFRQTDSVFIKVSKEVVRKGYLDWMDTSKIKTGSIFVKRFNPIKLRSDNDLRFNGHCFLLTGGNSFSAAVLFAAAFKSYDVGKIIGTETGGLTVCYGDVYHYELPNTKLLMGVSYKKFFIAGGKDDGRGVMPDYTVRNSFADYRKGIDRVLQFTLNLIKKEKK